MREPTKPTAASPGRLRRWTTRAGLTALGAVVLLGWTVAMGLGMVRAAPEHSTLDPAAVPYAQPGPHPVGVRDLTVPGGATPLPATVWYPAAASSGERVTYRYTVGMLSGRNPVTLATYPGQARRGAPADETAGPYPLVVLSPGFALGPGAYGWLAEHLATRGLVVVAPDHQEALDPSKLWQATVDRPQDLRAVIDHMTTGDDDVAAVVEPERIALAGHSYGGYAAQVMGGARVDTGSLRAACVDARRADDAGVFLCDALEPHLADMADRAGLTSVPGGLWPDWSDDRVDAVVSMAGDAVMFGEAGLRSLDVPVAAIGGTADRDTPYATGARLTYDHADTPRAIEVGLVGAEHFVFTGPCASVRRVMTVVPFGFCDDPTWNRASARDVVAHHVTAFLLAELEERHWAVTALGHMPGAGHDVAVRAHGYPHAEHHRSGT
jgi:predicted dienelactone hydrolase